MKKSLSLIFIVFFCLSVLFVNSVFVEASADDDSIDNVMDDLEEGKENIDKAKEYTDKEKWEYLSEEWKKMLVRKGTPLYYIDGFFNKISFVFMIMLGESYSFSVIFFFMFFLWLYLFLEISKIMKLFFGMNGIVPYGIGFAVTSLIGQTGTLRHAIEFFGDLLAKLTGFVFWVILFVIIFSLFGLGKMIGKIGKIYQQKLEEAEKEQEKWDRKKIHMFTEALSEGFGFK